MREQQERIYPERKEMETVAVVCDICGIRYAGASDSIHSGIRWDGSRHEYRRTCVQSTMVHSWPEDGHEEGTRCDICPKCFDEKLIPWLESHGIKPQKTELDW